MGQKVNPVGMRVGIIRDWQSRWYAKDNEYGATLMEDVKIREFIESYYAKLAASAADHRKADPQISRIEIERSGDRLTVVIRTGRPGVVIGQEGKSIEGLKKAIEKQTKLSQVQINAVEIANPNLDARLVARWIANELEARRSFRATQKKAIQNSMRAGAKGIKPAYPVVWEELIWPEPKDIPKEWFLCIPFAVTLIMRLKKQPLNTAVWV